MNFALILESLKFYKLKHARTIQIWFLLLYVLNLLVYILPVGDRDFSLYNEYVTNVLSGNITDFSTIPLSAGNWVIIGMGALIILVNGFFTLLYATLFAGEQDVSGQPQVLPGQPLPQQHLPGQSLLRCLAALPRLILLGILLVVPALLSACLFFIPLLVFGLMTYFLPLELTAGGSKLGAALQGSFTATRGFKLFLFIQTVMVSLIITLPQSLVSLIIPESAIPSGIVTSFFIAARAFAQGRLMGMLYQVIVKKTPPVLPSKPKETA